MRFRHLRRWGACGVLRMLACLALAATVAERPGWAGDQTTADPFPPALAEDAGSVIGFTAPLRTVTLAALQPGRIRELPAAEGERIEAGAPAIHLDDTVQRQRMKSAQALAESTIEIDLARVRKEHASRELERIEGLAASSSVSTKELGDARTSVEATELEFQQARFKHSQDAREYGLQKAMCEQMHVRAPFTGYVSAHLKREGDSVEDREGVLTLVQLDPLVVAIDCPFEYATRVASGQTVNVKPIDGAGSPRNGEVFFASRVADAASQTFKVKIKVANTDAAWMAGMRVRVDLFDNAVAAAGTDGAQDSGK